MPFTPEVLEKIEAEMKKIVKEALPLERYELDPEEAIELMEKKGETYKVELIKEHAGKGEKISFFRQGEFDELCAGPHVPDTSRVKAFKLTSCTGAYWRGDSDNKMLQRIYGTAFTKKEDLDNYLTMLEEAKKRDHRKLGKELGLFTIMDEGPGFPFFLPNGMVLRNTLIDYWREVHKRYGYVEISTPMMLNRSLWERSGHWDHYKENMYTTVIDDTDFAIKPMNCPGGMLVYKTEPHSYRELPLRMAELGLVHRHELSGALHGLFRVRCFTHTRNFWDVPLPLPELWEAVKWAVKPDGAVLFFAQCPYDKVLGASNLSMLRYEWVWYKSRCTGFLNARRAPLKRTENILVFYQKLPYYDPQFEQGKPYKKISREGSNSPNYGKFLRSSSGSEDGLRFPHKRTAA